MGIIKNKGASLQSSFAELLNLVSMALLLIVILISELQLLSIIRVSLLYTFCTFVFLGYVILDPKRGGVSFILALQFVLFISVPATFQISGDLFPFYARPRLDFMYSGFSILALSQLAIQLGFRVPMGKFKTTPKPKYLSEGYISKWAWYLGAFAFFIGLLLGPSYMLSTRGEIGELTASSDGIQRQLLFICRSLGLVAFLMILSMAVHSSSVKYRQRNKLLLFVAIPIFIYLNYPPTLPRTYLIGPLISITAIFVNYYKTSIKLSLFTLAFPLVYLVLPAIKSLGAGGSLSSIKDAISIEKIYTYVFRVDFDIYLWTVESLEYISSGAEYRWGHNFLGVLFFFVPRSLWPTKPENTGSLVSSHLGYIYNNVSSPLWAEAYVSLGVLGVIFVMLLFGIIISTLESRARSYAAGQIVIDNYSYIVLMAFVIIIIRGALNSVAPSFGSAFLALFAVYMFGKKRLVWRR